MKKSFYNLLGLVLITITGILLNLQYNGVVSGSDYLGHISASKGIIGNYKEITFFEYPLASDTMASILSLNTGLDITKCFMVYHIIIIIIVSLSFYVLGQKYNLGLIFSFLALTYFNFSMWAGLAYPYPATLIFVLFPLLCKYLLEKDILKWSILLLISLIIYWYAFFIFLVFVIIYLSLNKIKNNYLLLLIIFSVLLSVKLFFFKNTLGYSFLDPVGENWFTVYKSQVMLFVLLLSFSIPYLLIPKDSFEKLGLSLLILYSLIFLTFAYPFVIRSTFLVFFGLDIALISLFRSSSNKLFKIILVFLLVSLILPFSYINTLDVLSTKNYILGEGKTLKWVQSNYKPGFQVISDPTTVKIFKTAGARGYAYSYAQRDLETSLEIQNPSVVPSFFIAENISQRELTFISFVKDEVSKGYKNIEGNKLPVLIVVSNRTTYWLQHLTPESSATFPPSFYDFEGFKKFTDPCYFKQVYDKDSVYIYEYQDENSLCT